MDGTELIVQMCITFLAVFVGIPAGFWLEHWIDGRRQAEARGQLLGYLRQNISKNLQLIGQAYEELSSSGAVIFYPLDLLAWPYLSPQVAMLNDDKLTKELRNLYYELAHLERKIDTQYSWFTQSLLLPPGDPRVADLMMRRSEFVNASIRPHIKDTQDLGKQLLKSVDSKVSELGRRQDKPVADMGQLLIEGADGAALKQIVVDALAAHERKKLKRELLMFSYTTVVTAYLGLIAILLTTNPSMSISDVSGPSIVGAITLMVSCDFFIWGVPSIKKKNR